MLNKIYNIVQKYFIYSLIYCSVIGIWLMLSQKNTLLFLILGNIGALCTVIFCERLKLLPCTINFNLIGLYKFFTYCIWILKEVFKSSIDVSRRIWNDHLTSNSGFCKIQLPKTNDIGMIAFANSITLTPGTITIHIDHSSVIVHTLDKDLERSLIESSEFMMRKINKFADREQFLLDKKNVTI